MISTVKRFASLKMYGFLKLLVLLLLINVGCNSKNNAENNPSKTVIQFETFQHDFGTINYGDDATFKFYFTNGGKTPLIIANVRTSCGCTVPAYEKKPLKKGEKSFIAVKYNTRIIGKFKKSITVYCNATNSPVVLNISGEVIKD